MEMILPAAIAGAAGAAPAGPEWAVGHRVELTLAAPGSPVVAGDVFAYDDASQLLVIAQACSGAKGAGSFTYTVVRAASVASVKVVGLPMAPEPPLLPAPDIGAACEREAQNVAAAEDQATKIGINVPPEAQELFDMLDKTLRCSWGEGGSIVVLGGDVRIDAPYGIENVHGSDRAANHVRKVMEGQRRKRLNKAS
eukprot:m51a1_g6945 hypothetical protein (196) ;mRNA; f:249746-250881